MALSISLLGISGSRLALSVSLERGRGIAMSGRMVVASHVLDVPLGNKRLQDQWAVVYPGMLIAPDSQRIRIKKTHWTQ